MSAAAIIAIIQAIISGVPKLIELIQQGRDPAKVNLDEFISTDALAKIRAANQRAKDYIQNG